MELMLTMANKYLLGLYEKAMPSHCSWQEKFSIAKKYGFDWIELSIDATDEKIARLAWTKEEREDLLSLSIKWDIPIKTMNISSLTKYALGSKDKTTEEKGLDIINKSIVLASDLGVRFIQIPGYDVYFETGDEETHQRYLNNLKQVALTAAKYGVLVGFETMENEYMNTVEKAMEFVEHINNPYLQIYPDIGNITNGLLSTKKTLFDDLMRGKGHIIGVHLKETQKGIYREVPYGEGHTDFIQGIKAAHKQGVRMFLGEFWAVDEYWEEEIKKSSKFLHEQLSSVFNEEK